MAYPLKNWVTVPLSTETYRPGWLSQSSVVLDTTPCQAHKVLPVANSQKYCLISPCRDEETFLRRALDSVAKQSVPPTLWVVVDDGSTDGTPEILATYEKRLPYLRVIRRENRGKRNVGPGVIDAFYTGYETVNPNSFEYIGKLDLDLELPVNYFEKLMERMEENPRIGTCSGKAYYRDESSGKLVSEMIGDEMSIGASKFYRTACFQQIGGFVREVMWDGIDCHRCRMLGWIACSWDEPELRFIHLRPMGSSQEGIWVGRKRHGAGQYFMGTTPAYMAVSAIYRMTRPPRVVGGVAMAWGYIHSVLTGRPRYKDGEFRRFLRRYQWACLRHGKRKATRRLNVRQRDQWKSEELPVNGGLSTGDAR